jgi:hypothetical protein
VLEAARAPAPHSETKLIGLRIARLASLLRRQRLLSPTDGSKLSTRYGAGRGRMMCVKLPNGGERRGGDLQCVTTATALGSKRSKRSKRRLGQLSGETERPRRLRPLPSGTLMHTIVMDTTM